MRHISTDYLRRHRQYGFTIVELIVVITISGLLAALLFGPLDDVYVSNSRSIKNVIKVADTHGAIRSVEHLLSISTGFYNTLADHTGTNWDWRGNGSTNRVLITSNYATYPDESQDPTGIRTLLYPCGVTTPLINYNIYFVSGGTLYRRTMLSTITPCSGSNGQHQTCATISGPTCPSSDAILLTDVSSFTVDYYANSQDTTPLNDLGTGHTQYTDNTAPLNARSVVVTVTSKSGPGSIDTTSTSSIRVTRLNGS